jgi:hypothetical protein
VSEREIEREGATLFELSEDGVNLWWASFQSTKLSSSDMAKIAAEFKRRWDAGELSKAAAEPIR